MILFVIILLVKLFSLLCHIPGGVFWALGRSPHSMWHSCTQQWLQATAGGRACPALGLTLASCAHAAFRSCNTDVKYHHFQVLTVTGYWRIYFFELDYTAKARTFLTWKHSSSNLLSLTKYFNKITASL